MIFEIYQKLNNKVKELNKRSAVEKSTIEIVSQNINPRSQIPPRALNGSITNNSILQNTANTHSNLTISQPTVPLRRLRSIHYDEGESQSIPQVNKQSMVRKDLNVDLSKLKMVPKKAYRSSSHRRGLASNQVNNNVMVFDIKVVPPSRKILRKRSRSNTDRHQ
jgi:hypothetical protein